MPNQPLPRRAVLKGGSLLALTFSIGGASALLTPRQAHAKGVVLSVLNADERDTLESVGEVLLPGAKEAGLAEFVDHQLTVPYGDCLLTARSLDVTAPVSAFYRAALEAIRHAARAAGATRFSALAPAQQVALVKQMSSGQPPGWQGPLAAFAYFVLRSDAIDVCYGTVEAYTRMGVPYMPHITPERAW